MASGSPSPVSTTAMSRSMSSQLQAGNRGNLRSIRLVDHSRHVGAGTIKCFAGVKTANESSSVHCEIRGRCQLLVCIRCQLMVDQRKHSQCPRLDRVISLL